MAGLGIVHGSAVRMNWVMGEWGRAVVAGLLWAIAIVWCVSELVNQMKEKG